MDDPYKRVFGISGNTDADLSSVRSNELLCCPFCGKQPETYWDSGTTFDKCCREGFNITCCYVHITAIYKEDAIEKWNCRAT